MPRQKFKPAFSYGSVSTFTRESVEQYEDFDEKAREEYLPVLESKYKKQKEAEQKYIEECERIAKEKIEKDRMEKALVRQKNLEEFISKNPVIVVICGRYTTERPYPTAPTCDAMYAARLDPGSQVRKDFEYVCLKVRRSPKPPDEFVISDPRKCPRCYKRLTEGRLPEGMTLKESEVSEWDIFKEGFLPHLKIQILGDAAHFKRFRSELVPVRTTGYDDLFKYDVEFDETFDPILQDPHSHVESFMKEVDKMANLLIHTE